MVHHHTHLPYTHADCARHAARRAPTRRATATAHRRRLPPACRTCLPTLPFTTTAIPPHCLPPHTLPSPAPPHTTTATRTCHHAPCAPTPTPTYHITTWVSANILSKRLPSPILPRLQPRGHHLECAHPAHWWGGGGRGGRKCSNRTCSSLPSARLLTHLIAPSAHSCLHYPPASRTHHGTKPVPTTIATDSYAAPRLHSACHIFLPA